MSMVLCCLATSLPAAISQRLGTGGCPLTVVGAVEGALPWSMTVSSEPTLPRAWLHFTPALSCSTEDI